MNTDMSEIITAYDAAYSELLPVIQQLIEAYLRDKEYTTVDQIDFVYYAIRDNL